MPGRIATRVPDESPVTACSPSFLGIGAQRAATTWLHDCLRSHPELALPEQKEVHFFDENYDRGWQWYADQFPSPSQGRRVGEITPNYLDHPAAAPRIAADLPDVKLFAILREPVSRAISCYELLGHKFREKSFEEACRPGRYVVELGLYAKHLKRFYARFPRQQIKIFLMEDFIADPDGTLRDLTGFIGVAPLPTPIPSGRQTNSVVFPRAQRVLNAVGLGATIDTVKSSPVGSVLRSLAGRAKRRQRRRYDRARLRELFRDDVLELQDLIDRDLSHWLDPSRVERN